MTQDSLSGLGRLGWRLRLAAAPATPPRAPSGPPAPGRADRGLRLAAGRFLWRGTAVEAPLAAIWDVPIADPDFARWAQSFAWLDDLAAAATPEAEARARDWTDAWAARFGTGRGPGWAPLTVARRVARWTDHAGLLMAGAAARDRRLSRALAAQAGWLGRHWRRADPGPDRLEALAARLRAGLAHGRSPAPRLLAALDEAVGGAIAPDGSGPDRSPEGLARIFAGLARLGGDLRAAGHPVPERIARALAATAPVLRTLRHADGGLARFHGGGRGVPGALDHALAAAGHPPAERRDRAMGYARLAHGRTTVIVDAAAPPGGAAGHIAHAATLAFEMTSGRRPVIVSCGDGRAFGDRWRRAGRATPSHSTLTLDGRSSARLAGEDGAGMLRDGPGDVRVERRVTARSSGLIAGHDGYVASHGLTHVRQLHLSRDGRELSGEDVIATVEREDEAACERALDAAGGRIPFNIRFHLHPDVAAAIDPDGGGATLTLLSGEEWRLGQSGAARVTLERSVYLEAGAPAPRPARQVVLSAWAADYATRVTWTLAKAPQTPDAVRDLVHDDRPVLV